MSAGVLCRMRGTAKFGPARLMAKHLADGQWHWRSEIQPKVTRMFPPEFFARLERCQRSDLEARKAWWFSKTLRYMVNAGYAERGTPNGKTLKYHDFKIRLTEAGKARFSRLSQDEIKTL